MNSLHHKFKTHRFLDEAGDTTFYGKGMVPLLGSEGVSNNFFLGMLTINEPLEIVRQKVVDLQRSIMSDPYFFNIPSIHKKKSAFGYFLHAKDDIPEVRRMAYDLIISIDCKFDAVIGRKDYKIYQKKHNGNQAEFYADMFSHLLHDNIIGFDKLVLNIASRSRCTTHVNLERGLQKAIVVSKQKFPNNFDECKVQFNVQRPTTEPIINIADYFLWSIQRKVERNETRYFNYLSNKINNVKYLYQEV
jgi:hypothetical protein